MNPERKRVPTAPDVLPEALQSLPPVCQEGVRKVLKRLRKIREENAWSSPKTPEELNSCLPQIQKYAQERFEAFRPFKKRGFSWAKASDEAETAAWDATLAAGGRRVEARLAAWEAAMSEIGEAAPETPSWEMAWAAAWETIKDRPGFEKNPYLPLLGLYELGAEKIKFSWANDKERLAINFLVESKEQGKVRARLLFSDQEPEPYGILYLPLE